MTDPKTFTTDIAVRFRDLDAMGHVNNAVYFTYFEQGRLQFFIQLQKGGFDGFEFILAHIGCDYRVPVTLEDEPALHIQVTKIGGKSFAFGYRLVDRSNPSVLYATGESVQVCYDYGKKASVPVSGELKARLSEYLVRGA